MTDFSLAVAIQTPPERVWAVLLDIERWPEWTSTVTSVERADRGTFTVGSRARLRQPGLRPALWQVTELDEGKRVFTWVSRRPGVQVAGSHLVEQNGSGSRAVLSLRFSGLLGPLMARLYRGLNEALSGY